MYNRDEIMHTISKWEAELERLMNEDFEEDTDVGDEIEEIQETIAELYNILDTEDCE